MRKLMITLATAASALAVATPASAQYFPVPQGPAYGYHDNYGQVRRLQARIDRIQHRIERLDRRNILSNREARRLRDESRQIERRLRAVARYGLHPRERHDIEIRIARLEYRVRHEATDGNRLVRIAYYQGYYDRVHDGRDDRWEDDRGRDHDGRWDRDDDD
jgi:hypothetical protein